MKLKKTINIIIFLIVFFSAFAFIKLWQFNWGEAVIDIDGEQFSVILARNQHQWHKGLGGRQSLEPYDGMLFTFSEADRHGIVMRDMKFPIDILWIAEGQIIDIAANVQVEDVAEEDLTRYYPRYDATAVLEIPAGDAEKNKFVIGDPVSVRK